MPKRPRSHVIETESQIAFRRALPAKWVIDGVEHDYGLDRRVLICDPDGRLTGQEFGVQLKGTDDQTARGLRVAVSWDHCAYWESLPYPVLVVRFIGGSERLFAIWSHDRGRDFYDLDNKQAWFRFKDSDELTPERIGNLPAELDRFHRAVTRSIRLPIVLQASKAKPLDVSRLNRELHELVDSKVSIAAGGVSSSLKFEIDNGFAVDFGAGLAMRVHHPDGVADQVSVRDLLIVVGICLGQMGAFDDLELCVRAASGSRLLDQPDMLCQTVGILAHGRRHDLLLDVLAQSKADPKVVLGLLGVAAVSVGSTRNPDLCEKAARISEHLVELFSEQDRAVAVFNHACNLRSVGQHEEAVAQYRFALDLRDGYEDEIVYWTLRGGSEFLSRMWLDAAESYRRARALDDEVPLTREMWLEATVHAGSYAAALEAVRDFENLTSTERILGWTADRVIERFEISEQPRESGEISQEIAALGHLTPPYSEDACHEVAAVDPLDPAIWLAASETDKVVLDRLIGAFLRDQAEEWAAVLVQAAATGESEDQLQPWVERARRAHANLEAAVLDVIEQLAAHGIDDDEPWIHELFRLIHETTDSEPRTSFSIISSSASRES